MIASLIIKGFNCNTKFVFLFKLFIFVLSWLMLDCDSFQKFNDPENCEGYVCFSYISYGTSIDKSTRFFFLCYDCFIH